MKTTRPNRLTRALVAASLLTATSLSGALHAADLLSVYRDALAQDPVYAAARAAYEAAREASPQARAGVLPSISFKADANRISAEADANGRTSSNDYTQRGYSVSLTQPLFRMQNWIAVDQASLQVKQAEAVFADAKQSIVTRSAQAYFDVLLAQDNVALSAAQKKAFAEQLAQAKRNFEVGTSTIVDTY
jgi:outer membrane protein